MCVSLYRHVTSISETGPVLTCTGNVADIFITAVYDYRSVVLFYV